MSKSFIGGTPEFGSMKGGLNSIGKSEIPPVVLVLKQFEEK